VPAALPVTEKIERASLPLPTDRGVDSEITSRLDAADVAAAAAAVEATVVAGGGRVQRLDDE
jgi:hypothetical protein